MYEFDKAIRLNLFLQTLTTIVTSNYDVLTKYCNL